MLLTSTVIKTLSHYCKRVKKSILKTQKDTPFCLILLIVIYFALSTALVVQVRDMEWESEVVLWRRKAVKWDRDNNYISALDFTRSPSSSFCLDKSRSPLNITKRLIRGL